MNMEHIGKIIKAVKNTVNNGNTNTIVINDNNENKKHLGIYALDKSKFTPNTPETIQAEEIAMKLDDLQNYACYLNVMNKIGVMDAERLLRVVLNDYREKKNTKFPVRDIRRYFMNKYKHRRY